MPGIKDCHQQSTSVKGVIMKGLMKRAMAAITTLSLLSIGLMLAGCGSSGDSGGISSQVVGGTASVGAPLAGQVSLKDSSDTPQVKTTVIGNDGSYAIDVTDMKAPYIIQAKGSADGANYTLYSYADGTGTANINPLSNVIVASAAGVDDPAEVYNKDDSDTRKRISSNISATINTLLAKIQPLLVRYNANHTNPITGKYIANHLELDEMFDNVKITVSNGILSIINAKTSAVIFSGKVTDIANGNFYPGNVPAVPAVPAAPAGLGAVGGANQVTLSWSASTNATAYNVYYATTPGVTTTSGTKIANATSPYVQSGLASGTTYYYIVTAVNSVGESAASVQASAGTNAVQTPVPSVPAAPQGVMAVGGTNQATISWPAVSGATSYNIYYSTQSGVTTANGTKIANATSPAVQSGLASGTTYYYIVTALNNSGEGAASVQVAATTLAAVPAPTAPAAPAGVTAVGGANQATITWPAVSGATSYNLYRSTSSGVTTVTGTKIAAVTSPYVNTGLIAGSSYYYIVTAVNSIGESQASAQAMATTNPAPVVTVPAAPASVTATGGTNQVSLSWAAVSGATSYNVYYATTSGVTKTSGAKIVNATSPYVQTGLAAGTSYYYVVTAVNSAGESAASTQATATTAVATPVIDGAALYTQYCYGCHGTLGARTASQIQAAINANRGGMAKFLATGSTPLTADQVAAIAASM